jgi:hypothetical protein
MRTVLRSDEIATVWAAQTQPHGRCSSNMSFDGRKFYSYSTVVAEIIVHRGKVAYLVNDWHFSSTTSCHVGLVRCAIPKKAQRFEVPGIDVNDYRSFGDLQRVLGALQNNAVAVLRQSEKAREPKRTRLLIEAYHIVLNQRAFAAFFGLSTRKHAVTLPVTEHEMKTIIRKRAAQEKIARREREERAHLGSIMKPIVRRLLPDRDFTTRDVYIMHANAKRETEVSHDI